MSRRRRRVNRVSHERWLVSYADFITLLFAFFVVLYASSQVDKRKVGMLALAIQVAFQEMGVFEASTTEVPIDVAKPMPFASVQAIENTERTASLARIASHPEGALGTGVENGDLAKLQTELESTLAEEIERKEIALHRAPDGLVISLREVGFFGSGEAEMKSTSQVAFDRIATILQQGDYRLRIEGHTDNTPIHNVHFPSNWELSAARATEIVRLLIVRDGFGPERLSAAGYAEYHPVASNRTIVGRGINRRVDIVILGHVVPESGSTPGIAQNPPAAPVNQQLPVDKTAKPSAMVVPAPTKVRGVDGPLQQ